MRRLATRLTMVLGTLLVAAGSLAEGHLETEAPSEPSVPEGLFPVYRIPGILSNAQVASAIHCTNLGTTTTVVGVYWVNAAGVSQCIIADASVAQNETTTIATGATAAYVEDVVCGPVPAIDRGHAIVTVNDPTTLICTAQILDRAGATPAFVSALELFRP